MAGDASRRNGKLGGRPKGYVALAAEKMREKVMKQLEEEYSALWEPQFKKAREGDTNAFKEIREFAAGKPRQNLGLDGGEEGEPITVVELDDEQYKQLIREGAQRLDSQESSD